MEQPGWQCIYSQHGSVNILKPLLRSTAQKKNLFFKISVILLINHVSGQPRVLMEMYNEIYDFMSADIASIL